MKNKKSGLGQGASHISLKQRIIGMITAFVYIAQLCMPTAVWAANSLSHQQVIEIASSPLFEKSFSNSYLYEQSYVDDVTGDNNQNIASFHSRLVAGQSNLPAATLIPIHSSGITVFVPAHLTGKIIGDIFVQNRFVREQMFNLLGRHLIGANETSQINSFYENAFNFAKANPHIKFGDNLTSNQISTVTKDIIWPEYRVIENTRVLIPILYLTDATVSTYKVTKNTTEFKGGTASFNSIALNHADFITGPNTIVSVAQNLSIDRFSTIQSLGAVNLVVGGTLNVIGGSITGDKDVNIIANELNVKSVLVPFKDRYGSGTKLGRIASINSTNGNMSIETYQNINFEGAVATVSNGFMTLSSGQNISIKPLFTEYQSAYKDRDWKVNTSALDVIGSKLSARDTISLIADGVIEISASELISTQGGIELLAQQGIYIVDELSQEQIQRIDRKGKTTGQSSEFRTEAVRAILKAGKGVLLDSEYGDVVLKATEITSQTGTQVTARNGKVHLLMTKELQESHLQTVKKGTWTIKTRTEDIIHENNLQNAIVGGLQVQAAYGINVEYTGVEGATLREQIETYRTMPGMSWMADLYDDAIAKSGGAVTWESIEEVHKELKKTDKSLSPAAMAIIAVVVTICTAGAGTALIAATNTVVGSMAGAAITTIATQATYSLALGDDPIQTAKKLTTKESVREVAVSVVTAGALSYVGDLKIFEVADTNRFSAASLGKQATQAVVESTVSAGVATVFNGGNTQDFINGFKTNLATKAVNSVGKTMANKIGLAHEANDINGVVRYIAHAGAGCIMGVGLSEAGNSANDESFSCVSGAGGAVVGELAADVYKKAKIDGFMQEHHAEAERLRAEGKSPEYIKAYFSTDVYQDRINQQVAEMTKVGVDLAKLSGAFAALAAGGDVSLAAATAENAAKNNAFFLIPLAIMVLKAADIALTAYELYEIFDEHRNDPEALSKALGIWVGEELLANGIGKAVGKAIPGFKTAEELLKWLRNNTDIPMSRIDSIASSIKGIKGDKPVNSDKPLLHSPTPAAPLDLSKLDGKSSFVSRVEISSIHYRNDGKLGEQVAEQAIGDATGFPMKTIVKNNSDNGIDLSTVDETNKIIWIIEVKSSQIDKFTNGDKLGLPGKTERWLREAAQGNIAGKPVSAEAQQYAKDALDLIRYEEYKVKTLYSTVTVPKKNETRLATVTIQPIEG